VRGSWTSPLACTSFGRLSVGCIAFYLSSTLCVGLGHPHRLVPPLDDSIIAPLTGKSTPFFQLFFSGGSAPLGADPRLNVSLWAVLEKQVSLLLGVLPIPRGVNLPSRTECCLKIHDVLHKADHLHLKSLSPPLAAHFSLDDLIIARPAEKSTLFWFFLKKLVWTGGAWVRPGTNENKAFFSAFLLSYSWFLLKIVRFCKETNFILQN